MGNVTCSIERVKEMILEEFPNFYECGEVTQESMIAEFVMPVDVDAALEHMRETEGK